MTSIFDWLSSAPSSMGGLAAPQGTPPGPSYGTNNLGLIGAALQDAGASASGRPDGGAMLTQFQNRGLMANQARARQTLAQAMQSGDPSAIQKARAGWIAAGGDPSLVASQLMATPNGNIVGVDPLTQSATVLYKGGARPPRGYQWGGGNALEPIPGGPADPQVIARRLAARRGMVPADPADLPAAPAGVPPAMQGPFQYDEQGVELQ